MRKIELPNPIRATVDLSEGHVWTPTFAKIPQGRTVLINNLPAITTGDEYEAGIHVHPVFGASHFPVALAGSPNVFVQGLPLHRSGDAISCGDKAANGSPNVFVNEAGSPGGVNGGTTSTGGTGGSTTTPTGGGGGSIGGGLGSTGGSEPTGTTIGGGLGRSI